MAEKTSNNREDSTEIADKNNSYKIGEFSSVELYSKDGLSSIVEATKAVNMFPSGPSRDLYCTYPTFGKIVDVTSERILSLIQGVIQRNENVRGNIQRRQKDEQFELLAECNDVMLEKINLSLDEMAGFRRNPQTSTMEIDSTVKSNMSQNTHGLGSWNVSKTSDSPSRAQLLLLAAKNISRPQVNFKTPVDNSDKPFEPKLKEKPNSLKPLAILPEYDEDGNIESYLHPYEFEIIKFEPLPAQLEKIEPKLPKKIENTPFELIENEEQLKNMISYLRNVNIIAVDVEHHSYRSFQGIACLIQLSTRTKDYIIDGIKLRDELHLLNEIFTNTKILKIFHGADLDVQWLQRDFALYIVNMFDTHQASKILGLPRLSLAYLLKHFCDIDADKTYQLADWRIRPLPEELIYYARQDTHYLIYIYELLHNELLKKANDKTNLLKQVYQCSKEICKKRYIKPYITSDSYIEMYRKSKRIFDNRQLFALKEIFEWRDKISRKEDESYGYVLPNHMMLQISESLPREMQGILACCNPIPPLVRLNLHTLHQIILKARDQPLIKPFINEQIENRRVINTVDIDNKLYCPHDLSHDSEFRDDLPTLLNSKLNTLNDDLPILAVPNVSVFENSSFNDREESVKNILQNIKKVKFVTPYERYKAIIPYAQQQKLEEITKEEEIKKSKQLCPEKIELDPIENSKSTSDEEEDDDNKYKLPVKKYLKRKREESKSSSKSNNLDTKKNLTNDHHDEENLLLQKNIKKEIQNDDEIKTDTTNKNDNQQPPEEENKNSDKNVELKNVKKVSNKKQWKKNNKPLPKLKTGQSSDQPIDFDYSKFDYSKFDGGATESKSTSLKSKFKGKGKGSRASVDRKFNKMFSFSKTKK